MNNKALTYSLLAHIRDNETIIEGPVEIFIPLIKRVLARLNSKNSVEGKSLNEIKEVSDELYSIDFPIPVLSTILHKIKNQINTELETHFQIYDDGSFQIHNYSFTQYEEVIEILSKETLELNQLYTEFCNNSDVTIKANSIFDFIRGSKYSLGKYLGKEELERNEDNLMEIQFVSFFKKVPHVFSRIKRIYLGSILASFLEYKTSDLNTDLELLFDTNFVIALLDLNTPESTHSCHKLLEVAKRQNFKLSILQDTIQETEHLLRQRATYFNKSFLVQKVNPEDIYNACDRRGLKKSDIERIADKLESFISSNDISILYETKKYRNKAKFSKEYKKLQKVRTSNKAALHDATAIEYVQIKRGKKITSFEKVNCWFVNNAISRTKYSMQDLSKEFYQPYSISANDLLNILWLSNPEINISVTSDELSTIGINSLLSLAINEKLPGSKTIQELQDNIERYALEDIDDSDVLLIAKRITNKELKSHDIYELNKIASTNTPAFVERLNTEALIQSELEEQRAIQFKRVLEEIKKSSKDLDEFKSKIDSESKVREEMVDKIRKDKEVLNQKLIEQKEESRRKINSEKEKRKNSFIKSKTKKWQYSVFTYTLIYLLAFMVLVYSVHIFLGYDWEKTKHSPFSKKYWFISFLFWFFTFIGTFFIARLWCYRFFDPSKIKAFKDLLEIPYDMKKEE